MKLALVSVSLLGGMVPAFAQQNAAARWEVEIPAPVANKTEVKPAPKPQPPDSAVLKSRVMRIPVTEAPELAGLPPITGVINATVKLVEDPGLPDPPKPLPPLPPTDPAVLARLKELRANYHATLPVFVSGSVYDGKRTLIKIYPNGQADNEVVAWSNLNFMYLSGNGGYRVNFADGTYQDYSLLMAVGPVSSENARRAAERTGRKDLIPQIPELPDVEAAGPKFVVVKGDRESDGMHVLEQLHDLFQVSGETMKQQYFAREQARAERKACLLANPPKPQDVAIRIWKRQNPVGAAQSQEGGNLK